MRRVTLLAVLALAGCGGAPSPHSTAAAKAERICDDSAVPGVPAPLRAFGVGPRMTARMAQLAVRQERREIARLHALRWRELDRALVPFERSLPHLDAFIRSQGAATDERVAYGRLLARWQTRAAGIGLDHCSRFGFSY